MSRVGTDWTGVDWRLQDVVLAAGLGLSRERVRQARLRFANGIRAVLHRRSRVVSARSCLAAMATEDVTLPELARLAGCGVSNVSTVLRELGKGFRRRPRSVAKYDWTRIPADWAAMTDRELAAIVGVGNPSTVTHWRHRHRMNRGYSRTVSGSGNA